MICLPLVYFYYMLCYWIGLSKLVFCYWYLCATINTFDKSIKFFRFLNMWFLVQILSGNPSLCISDGNTWIADYLGISSHNVIQRMSESWSPSFGLELWKSYIIHEISFIQHKEFNLTKEQESWVVGIMLSVTLVKLLLVLYCRSFTNEIVKAYAQDHFFDVITNIIGLIAVILANYIDYWIDPVGAIIVSFQVYENKIKSFFPRCWKLFLNSCSLHYTQYGHGQWRSWRTLTLLLGNQLDQSICRN